MLLGSSQAEYAVEVRFLYHIVDLHDTLNI